MYVEVDLSEQTVRLFEADDLDRLHVEVVGGFDEGRVDLLLGHLGRLAGVEHAFLSVEGLRRSVGELVDDESWRTGFEAMLVDAAERGRLSDDRASVRAHVVWPPDTVA